MESYEDIKPFSKSLISPISYSFVGTSLRKSYLYGFLSPLVQDCTLKELNQNLFSYCKRLKLLKMFDECNVVVQPGRQLNTAVVTFNLQENQPYGAILNTKIDPFRLYAQFYIRRLLRRPNETLVKIGMNPRNYDPEYEFSHLEKLGFFDNFQQKIIIGRYSSSLDVNLLEKSDVISAVFKSLDGKHKIEYGKSVRRNLITIQNASKRLINITPAVTDKNFFKYTLTLNNLDNIKSGPLGWYLALSNEIATGKNLFFHKISTDFSSYHRLIDNIFLINYFQCGFFVPWPSTKIKINDNFRITNFKGFDHIGLKEPPRDPDLSKNHGTYGDHFGSETFASLQTKLLFYKFPFLSELKLRPFLYGSLAFLKEKPGLTENLRGAVGFGFNFQLSIGSLELVYTSAAWKRNGDVPAELQLLIYSRY